MKAKLIGAAALSALALLAIGASTASATTLEVNGVTKNEPVTILASLEPGTSFVVTRTDGFLLNTCLNSHFHGATAAPYTGSRVTGPLTTKFYGECVFPVVVHKPGQFYIEHIAGTTNATLFFENTEVTVSTAMGVTVNCKSGQGTDVGKLTGAQAGLATVDFHAIFNCGFLLPSATLAGSYWVTSPAGLGVSA